MKATAAEPGLPLDARAASGAGAAPSEVGLTFRRLWRLKWGLAATVLLLLIIASAVLAPWVAPKDPLTVDIRHRLVAPAWMAGGTRDNILGTDQVGRDLFSRVVYGGRVSLVVGVAAVLISASIGVLLGLGAGYIAARAPTSSS